MGTRHMPEVGYGAEAGLDVRQVIVAGLVLGPAASSIARGCRLPSILGSYHHPRTPGPDGGKLERRKG